MRKINYSIVWLILISGIVITLLFNIKVYWYVLGLLGSGRVNELPIMSIKRSDFGISLSIYHFVIFSILALFNYFWKEKIVPASFPRAIRIMIIIVFNILIYWIYSYLEGLWFNANFDFREKIFPTDYFLTSNLPIAVIGVAEAYIMLLFRKVKTTELEKNLLREEKTNAELAALKDQISPHFFFNTLSSLSTLVRNEKKEVALEFIQEMSNTYRYTLASKQQDLVSLEEELKFVQSYLFLLKKRFGEKLVIIINIPEKFRQKKVPPMSVQLLVENAVQHNLMTKDNPLNVQFYVKENKLIVENSLQEKEQSNGLGMGLENLSNRYKLLAQEEIIIEKNQHYFRVQVPLL